MFTMQQEMEMDIRRLPESTETGKDEVDMVQKGQLEAAQGTDVEEEAQSGKRSRLRMVAIITALFVSLDLLTFSMASSMNEMPNLPTKPSHATH